MPKPSEYDKTHLRNMAAMGTRIDRIFKKAAEEAAKIGVSIKDIDPDKIFSFEDYPETKKQVERLLNALKETTETTIANGINTSWQLSNNKNDAMAEKIFGRNADKLPEEQRKKYFNNNESALQAFLERKVSGLNLSDRVWKYTNAFKKEIELGLDCGIRSGKDAASMARELQQYLQHPDKLFRRVRDEHGLLQLSKAASEFHPGQGVYRSSYKNARRLAATETNIAYRTADHLRWQQMDFVVGIEIKLSNNHTILLQPGEKTDDKSQQRADGSPKANAVRTLVDICDTLQGRYPKDFKFTGWHPHCRCHVVTILKTEDEMAEDTQRILDGKAPSKESVNTVEDVPQAFKDHIEKYSERIQATAPGRLPYYVQDNRKRVDQMLGLQTQPKLTPQEIGEKRHAERTEQDRQGILQRWNESRLNSLKTAVNNGLLPEGCNDKLAQLAKLNTPEHFEEFQTQIKTLQAQAQRHAARTPQDIADIKARWDKRVFTNDKIRRDADRVLTLAKSYSEVDYAQLEKFIAKGKLAEMDAETQKVLQALKDMREQERALSDILGNVHKWHKEFTISELEVVKKNVIRTMSGMPSDYEARIEKLKFEADWVEKHKKYATWNVAQDAYKKEIASVQRKIEEAKITDAYKELAAFATKSKTFKTKLEELKLTISTPGFNHKKAEDLIEELKEKKAKLKSKKKGAKDETNTIVETLEAAQPIKRETLEELKARLGDKCPATLNGLNEAIEEYEKKSLYGERAKEYKQEIENTMRRLFDAHDLGLNIKEGNLDKVLDSWFKNTFETGSSGGYIGSSKTVGPIEESHSRLGAAHRLFGIGKDLAKDQLSRHEYEKYGNLLDHNILESLQHNSATQYGCVEVRFKKDKVIATWTPADSLCCRYQPTLVSDPRACSYDDMRAQATMQEGEQIANLEKFKDKHIHGYLELQYHGDLTLDCVESISFPYNLMNEAYGNAKKIAEKCKEKGIPVYYMDEDDGKRVLRKF